MKMKNCVIEYKFHDLETSCKLIENTLKEFIQDKRLHLTEQGFSRAKRLLSTVLFDETNFSRASIYSYLCHLHEYRKDYPIDVGAGGEAEDMLIYIIGAADIMEGAMACSDEQKEPKKKTFECFIPSVLAKSSVRVSICLIAIVATGLVVQSVNTSSTSNWKKTPVTDYALVNEVVDVAELKTTVKTIMKIEKERGNFIHYRTVWNTIKNLDAVARHGEVNKYEELNLVQYAEAKKFLQNWLKRLNA